MFILISHSFEPFLHHRWCIFHSDRFYIVHLCSSKDYSITNSLFSRTRFVHVRSLCVSLILSISCLLYHSIKELCAPEMWNIKNDIKSQKVICIVRKVNEENAHKYAFKIYYVLVEFIFQILCMHFILFFINMMYWN